jgi:hypothetical protein
MKELKMYYGITDFKPMLVNPNKAELAFFLEKEVKNDPKYDFHKDGVDKLRIDVYGVLPEGDNFKTKVSFWLENRLDISKSGKQKYINGQGLTTYNLEKLPKHIYSKNFREAYVGEETLVNFLSKTLSWKVDVLKMKPGEVPDNFINVSDLFKGRFSEIGKTTGKTVKVYVGAITKDGFTSTAIYNKLFLNSMAKNLNPLIEALSSQYTSFYGNVAPIQENFVLGSLSAPAPEPRADDFDENLPF